MTQTAHCAPQSAHDLSVLREFVGEDPATLARFVALGLHSLDQALRPLQEAQGALAPLREAAHRAKSTARQLGADAWAEDCEALECAARDGQHEAAMVLRERLLQSWPALRAGLHASMERLQSQADTAR